MMLTALLPALLKGALLGLLTMGLAFLLLRSLFWKNRRLFWCVVFALSVHLGVAGLLWGAGKFADTPERPRRIAITVLPAPPPKPEVKPPSTLPVLPWGSQTGDHQQRTPPRGTNRNGNQTGAPGDKVLGNNHTLVEQQAIDGELPTVPGEDSELFGPGNTLDPREVTGFGPPGHGGDRAGVPDGQDSETMPFGWKKGQVNGRVYFIRLKHGSGAWNAGDDGITRLLAYLDKNAFPCQRASWAVTAAEMREKYLQQWGPPTFIYLYCDESFSLSHAEVAILRDYLLHGGFLFIDSRPDDAIKARLTQELSRIVPESRLAPLPATHPINRFLFELRRPAVGENIIDKRNYGITRGGKLVVFYTMGNFAHLYASFTPETGDYILAQYQMGANVMVYALNQGDDREMVRRNGANASVTTQTIEGLRLFTDAAPDEGPNTGTVKVTTPTAPKTRGTTTAPPVPEEITLF